MQDKNKNNTAMQVPDSPRLSFALLTQNEGHLLYELDSDPEVMRYISDGKTSSMDFINNTYLPRLAKFSNPEKGWGIWKVIVKESQDFIGWVLVRPMDFFGDTPKYDDLEMGWRFMQKAWGKGYATEAAQAIKNVVEKQDDVNFISAIAEEDNIGSISIMKKLGLDYIKTDIHKDPLGDAELVFYQQRVTNN